MYFLDHSVYFYNESVVKTSSTFDRTTIHLCADEFFREFAELLGFFEFTTSKKDCLKSTSTDRFLSFTLLCLCLVLAQKICGLRV